MILLAAAADVSPCEAGDFATGSRSGYKITLIKDLPILTSGVSAVRSQHLGLVRIGNVIQIICPRREQLAGLLASSIGQGTIDAIESGGSFFVGSLHIGVTTPITNWYSLGGGVDAFYDGAFTKRPSDDNPLFTRYKIDEDKFSNKLRLGISVNNEVIMGRLSAIID